MKNKNSNGNPGLHTPQTALPCASAGAAKVKPMTPKGASKDKVATKRQSGAKQG